MKLLAAERDGVLNTHWLRCSKKQRKKAAVWRPADCLVRRGGRPGFYWASAISSVVATAADRVSRGTQRLAMTDQSATPPSCTTEISTPQEVDDGQKMGKKGCPQC
uniref:Uncharacterized protein n=1 Tax=Plectus sambesii TaxID=2011161 RepID=A0A914ULQ0_9BILA